MPIFQGYNVELRLNPNDPDDIIIKSKDNVPALDPNSPEFDEQLYAAVKLDATASLRRISSYLTEAYINISEPLQETMERLKESVNNFFNSNAGQTITAAIKYIVDNSDAIQEKMAEWRKLEPFLEEELKKPEYQGRSIDELMAADNDTEMAALIQQAFENAKAAMLAQELMPKVSITEKGAKSLEYPLDKINANVWGLLVEADKNGQLTFAAERRGSKKTADIIYGINFDDLPTELIITKKLTAFDKRVYIAAGALFNNDFDIITPAQIYAAMGNTGRPSAADVKKINDSITKMAAANIYIDNTSEHKLYKNYAKFVYDAKLLPMERITAIVNGQTVDSAIHLFREPPLISFAKERKQITTIKRELLESPLSKTDANLQIDDYLIERISHIKKSRGKISNKILYSTIFDNAGISTKMQRKRAKEKITKYLDHYLKCGFIKGYTENEEGVTVKY